MIIGPNKPGERIFDIRDYGAKCDGATDDTDAYLATVEAANAAGGGKVFVPHDAKVTLPKK